MKKILLFFYMFVVSTSVVWAQADMTKKVNLNTIYTLQQQGDFIKAENQALELYEKSSSELEKSKLLLLLGQLSFQQGRNAEANAYLNELKQSQFAHPYHSALIQGHIALSVGNIFQARDLFTQAAKSKDHDIQMAAQLNLLKVVEDNNAGKKLLQQITKQILSLEPAQQTRALWLKYVARAIDIDAQLAMQGLAQLSAQKSQSSKRELSEAFGLKAKLYFKHQRLTAAGKLINQAIFHAQQEPDLLLQWEWLNARIYKQLSQQERSLQAYRRAIGHLEKIRNDIPVRYVDGRSSFKELLSPLYMQFSDSLISYSESHPEQAQKILLEVQNTIERLKFSELVDYFKNACDISQYPILDIAKRDPHSAILYPIMFDDRLEILLGINGKLQRFTQKVKKRKLARIVRRAVSRVRPTATGDLRPFSYREISQIYRWMIKPIQKTLRKAKIDTLVYVPDGVLRTLPLSMLWDGKHYLVENYAVATLPGLSLLEPQQFHDAQYQVSLAGVSQPGKVVEQLPRLMDTTFITNEESQKQRKLTAKRELAKPSVSMRALPTKLRSLRSLRRAPIVLRQQQLRQLQEALALPGVKEEVTNLSGLLNARAFLDNDFALDKFKQSVKGSRVIHIASHALFSGDPETSFIMAHDRVLDMNEIDNMFRSESFSKTPVELLTLSACQTAEGDDRSPLGLSGVALKSGARSVLGSLWPVSDNAAKITFPSFYRQMIAQDKSKAKALQYAQQQLLKDKDMAHPFYWAPFIVMGNWL